MWTKTETKNKTKQKKQRVKSYKTILENEGTDLQKELSIYYSYSLNRSSQKDLRSFYCQIYISFHRHRIRSFILYLTTKICAEQLSSSKTTDNILNAQSRVLSSIRQILLLSNVTADAKPVRFTIMSSRKEENLQKNITHALEAADK